jgi:hypothetical protein
LGWGPGPSSAPSSSPPAASRSRSSRCGAWGSSVVGRRSVVRSSCLLCLCLPLPPPAPRPTPRAPRRTRTHMHMGFRVDAKRPRPPVGSLCDLHLPAWTPCGWHLAGGVCIQNSEATAILGVAAVPALRPELVGRSLDICIKDLALIPAISCLLSAVCVRGVLLPSSFK